MKLRNRILTLLTAVLFLFSFTACNRDKDDGEVGKKDVVELKVWGAQEDQEMLKKMVEEFKKENNTDVEYKITFGVVGEKDTQTKILEDPDAAADVFAFPDDQLRDLVNAGALYEITLEKEQIEVKVLSKAPNLITSCMPTQ